MAYVFGGIALDTTFTFEQLETLDGRTPRLSLTLDRGADIPLGDDVMHRSLGRYGLTWVKAGQDWIFKSRLPGIFVFSPDRCRITCHDTDGDPAWQDVLFRRVLPRVATTYGAAAIHAAAVAIDDRCLLLLGRSGAGKSTLTTFCATAGWRVLSDDITLVWNDDGQLMVEPVQHGTGVWDDVRDALRLPDVDCTLMAGYDDRKWCYRPSQAISPDARALSAVLVLERSPRADAPILTPMSPNDALRTLMEQNIPFAPKTMPGAVTAASFGRIAAVARRVPCLRMTYPDGYAALPDVERLLRHVTIGDEE